MHKKCTIYFEILSGLISTYANAFTNDKMVTANLKEIHVMIFKKKKVENKPKLTDIPVKIEGANVKKPVDQTESKKYKIIAVTSGKGGVGKSTVTVNLAFALKSKGLSVGVLDADIYGPSQVGLLGAFGKDLETTDQGKIIPACSQGVYFVSSGSLVQSSQAVLWRAPMVNKLIMQFLSQVQWPEELDVLLFDLPPGTGDIHITLCQKAKIDGALVVTTPQHVATQVAERGLQMLKKVNVPVWGIIENMGALICKKCGTPNALFDSDAADNLAKHYDLPILAKIPLETTLSESCEMGKPIIEYAPDSYSSKAFISIADQVIATAAVKQSALPNYNIVNGQLVLSNDTSKTHLAYDLRLNCQCATCVDENTGKKLLNSEVVSKNILITSLKPVGQYGLQLYFSDGHHTGIYKYSDLL
jgi:ATP-binding protein involved in chromosome partitioning